MIVPSVLTLCGSITAVNKKGQGPFCGHNGNSLMSMQPNSPPKQGMCIKTAQQEWSLSHADPLPLFGRLLAGQSYIPVIDSNCRYNMLVPKTPLWT